MLLNIWGTISFVGALFLATLLTAYKLEKKSLWAAKAIGLAIFVSLISFGYNELVRIANLSPTLSQLFKTTNCVLLFVLSLAAMRICCVCSHWEALFCCAAGYCMQHITQRLSVLTAELLSPALPDLSKAILLFLITGFCYFFIYYKIIQNRRYNNIMVDSKVQVVITIMVLFVTIIMSSFAGLQAEIYQANSLKLYIYGFSIISGMLALFVEFCLLFQKNTENERDILKQLMHESQNQYKIEKSTIDMINIKCHDLKHQLHKLEKKINSDELSDIKKAVNAYDFIFKTGNTALDTVLTMKGLYCEDKNIVMTCIADGQSLSFISDSDIYSLFGNILDNAIEAVDQLPETDKRIIGLTIAAKHGYLYIHSENYHTDLLSFVNGIPQTTKRDKAYHGFGVHSIRLLTEKYNGTCIFEADEDTFHLNIQIPLAKPATEKPGVLSA